MMGLHLDQIPSQILVGIITTTVVAVCAKVINRWHSGLERVRERDARAARNLVEGRPARLMVALANDLVMFISGTGGIIAGEIVLLCFPARDPWFSTVVGSLLAGTGFLSVNYVTSRFSRYANALNHSEDRGRDTQKWLMGQNEP